MEIRIICKSISWFLRCKMTNLLSLCRKYIIIRIACLHLMRVIPVRIVMIERDCFCTLKMYLISWLGRHAYIRMLARLVYLVYYSVYLLVFLGFYCFCFGIFKTSNTIHVIFIAILGFSLKRHLIIDLLHL